MARPAQTSDEAVLAAVAAHPEATAAELADALGMGQSTAAKRLAALEVAGAVRRIPGGRENGRRVADRWARHRYQARHAGRRDDRIEGAAVRGEHPRDVVVWRSTRAR